MIFLNAFKWTRLLWVGQINSSLHDNIYLWSIPHTCSPMFCSLKFFFPRVVCSLYSRSLFLALTDINDTLIWELKREGQCVLTIFPEVNSQCRIITCNSHYFQWRGSPIYHKKKLNGILSIPYYWLWIEGNNLVWPINIYNFCYVKINSSWEQIEINLPSLVQRWIICSEWMSSELDQTADKNITIIHK